MLPPGEVKNSLRDRVKQTGIKSGFHSLGQVDLSSLCLSFLNWNREDKIKGENMDELFRTSSTDSVFVSYCCWNDHHECNSLSQCKFISVRNSGGPES